MRGLLAFVGLIALLLAGAALAEPVTISGKVVGPDGQGVAGAEVVTMEWQAKTGGVATKKVSTEADGGFSFQVEIPPYLQPGRGLPVMARKAGLAMAAEGAQPGVPVVLKLGGNPETRSGVVTDAYGKPIAGAQIIEAGILRATPTSQWGMSMHLPELKAVTDERGRFSFAGFAAEITLYANVVAEGYAGARVNTSNATPVKVALAKAAGISGKVLVNGQPQAGVRVSGFVPTAGGGASSDGTMTAADGSFTLARLGAGQAGVRVIPPAGFAPPLTRSVKLEAGQTATDVDFNLTPGAVVRGRVLDAKTGEPVGRAAVTAVADVQYTGQAQADDEGRYELRLAPGTFRLQTTAPAYRDGVPFYGDYPEIAQEITVKEGDVIEGKDLTVKLPRKVRGQVLLPDGQPATGAKIVTMGSIGLRPNLQLDADGRFEMDVPEPPASMQSYNPPMVLLVTEPEKNLAAFVNPKTLPDQLTITLQPAGTVTIDVTDPEGRPLEGFGVTVAYPLGERYGWTSQGAIKADEKGIIRLGLLPAGVGLHLFPDETMRRLMVGDELGKQELSLKPGEERVLPPVVVNPKGRSLNVFVGTGDGKPVKGAQVWAPGFAEPAVTDEQGKVTLTKLPLKGKVALLAVHPTEQCYGLESADPDAGVWPGVIVKPLGTATGVLVSKADAKPLTGAQVMAQPGQELLLLGYQIMQRLGLAQWMKRVPTDEQGRWRLTNLIPGVTYQLIVFRGQAGSSGGSFVAEGGAEEQDAGTMECDPPAPPVPAGAPGAPPPPPPPPAG